MLDRIRQSKLRPAVCSSICIVFLAEVQHWQLQYMLLSSVFKICYRPGLHLHYGQCLQVHSNVLLQAIADTSAVAVYIAHLAVTTVCKGW